MSAPSRIASLDGLRGIAAVGVMIFHFDHFFLPQAALTSMLPFMRPILNRAYLGVDLFFLMSGFVMAHIYGQKLSSNWRAHWRDFAIMRFARIYPLFVLTTLVVVVTHALAHIPLSWISFSSRSLALQPLLLQVWVALSWNYPSWSISTEAAAYAYFVFSAGALLTGKISALHCCYFRGHTGGALYQERRPVKLLRRGPRTVAYDCRILAWCACLSCLYRRQDLVEHLAGSACCGLRCICCVDPLGYCDCGDIRLLGLLWRPHDDCFGAAAEFRSCDRNGCVVIFYFSMARARALRCDGVVFGIWSSDADSGRHCRKIVDAGHHAGRGMPIGPNVQLL